MYKRRFSRKNKQTKQSKTNRQHKLIGGATSETIQLAQQPAQQLAPEHGGLMDIFGPVVNLVTNAAIKGTKAATESAANALGVSTEKNDLPEVLKEVSIALNDPKTKENVKEIAGELAKDALIVAEAAGPAAKEVAENVANTAIELGQKEGENVGKAVIDVVGTLPVVGEVVEGVRVLDDVVKAGEAAADAAAKTAETMADGVTQTEQKLQQMKEQGKVLTNPFVNQSQQQAQQQQQLKDQVQQQAEQAQQKFKGYQDQAQMLKEQAQQKFKGYQDQGQKQIQYLQKQGEEAQKRAETAIQTANRTNLLSNLNRKAESRAEATEGGSTRRHHKKYKSILKSKKSKNGLKNKTRKRKNVRFSM